MDSALPCTEQNSGGGSNEGAELVRQIWASWEQILTSGLRSHIAQNLILAFTLLRRVECILTSTKKQACDEHERLRGSHPADVDRALCSITGVPFYNTSSLDLENVTRGSRPNTRLDLIRYIQGFSASVYDILEPLGLPGHIRDIPDSLLYRLIEHFARVDLHPPKVSNSLIMEIFDELSQRVFAQTKGFDGEKLTPRDVSQLVAGLLCTPDAQIHGEPSSIPTIYDPACGTGGMLTAAVECLSRQAPHIHTKVFGQELAREAHAICKARMLLNGQDFEHIALGNTLSADGNIGRTFDYILSTPPWGMGWRGVEGLVRDEHERLGFTGRFGAGLPRVSDGSLLWVQHMLSKQKPSDPHSQSGGSRLGLLSNRSPLFAGEAGSGESDIRRWIIENDWLEAIISLPDQLFFHTGISTYLWVLSTRKLPHRRGKVQLIDASGLCWRLQKPIGFKRHELGPDHAGIILATHQAFTETRISRLLDNQDLGYRRLIIDVPLRLNFQTSFERIERLKKAPAFQKLAKAEGHPPSHTSQEGRELQQRLLAVLHSLAPQERIKNREEFNQALQSAFTTAGLHLSAPLHKTILSCLSEYDETADICIGAGGRPEPALALRDAENVPLQVDPTTYLEREVKPHVPDAWVDPSKTRVGYEIRFERYFHPTGAQLGTAPSPRPETDPLQQKRRLLLQQARIRNFGPFEHLTIRLRPSLNVITGLNGAGKTQCIGALLFALGGSRTRPELKPGNASVVELRLSDAGVDSRVITRTVPAADGTLEVRQRWRDAPPGVANFVHATLPSMLAGRSSRDVLDVAEWQLVSALNLLAELEARGYWRTLLQLPSRARADRLRMLSAGDYSVLHLALIAATRKQAKASLPLFIEESSFLTVSVEAHALVYSLLKTISKHHQVIFTSVPDSLPEALKSSIVAELDKFEARTNASSAFFSRWSSDALLPLEPRIRRAPASVTPTALPRIFISYSQDSDEHNQRVLNLAGQLRAQGLDCRLDRYVTSPPEGWSSWCEREIQDADKVLVVCTESYQRRWEGTEQPGAGLGARWEASLIRQILYDSGGVNARFIPVVFDEADERFIPVPLRAVSRYRLGADASALAAHLSGGPLTEVPPLGPSRKRLPRPTIPIASRGFRSEPEPVAAQSNPSMLELTQRINRLYHEKETFSIEGRDTTAVQQQILEARRALREGGQLQNNDLLCDGRFKLLESIGHGGFGTVYRAYDRRDQRLVAVKVLHSQYAGDLSRRERFFRGARQMARLSHPGVVRVILQDAEDHGFFFFVMEYIGGGDLRNAVLQKRLDDHAALRVVLKTAAAVQHAHQHGLIHRDVKPANILLDADHPKLTDFDLVWTADTTGGTRTGGLGTVIYTAPETSVTSVPSISMDVFGLGMCAVFGLYGRELPLAVLSDRRAFIQALPCLKPIQKVLLQAVEVDPSQRFVTVAEFAAALQEALVTAEYASELIERLSNDR